MRTYLPVVTILKVQTSGYDKDKINEHTCLTYHDVLLVYQVQRVRFYSFYQLKRCRFNKEKVIIVTMRTVPLK